MAGFSVWDRLGSDIQSPTLLNLIHLDSSQHDKLKQIDSPANSEINSPTAINRYLKTDDQESQSKFRKLNITAQFDYRFDTAKEANETIKRASLLSLNSQVENFQASLHSKFNFK